jgi:excisionase family DNA binding protein
MRGLNAFQMAQMKHRDARVFALCQHLRAAIDVLEQIASEPFQPPRKTAPDAPSVTPAPPPEILPEKLAFMIKEAAAALGIGTATLWRAISDGKLVALKLGGRTLIPADSLRQWVASMPRRGRQSPGSP